MCNYCSVFDATLDATPNPRPLDPMIEAAERHMRMLQEVEEMAMAAARASQTLVVATAMTTAALVREDGGEWASDMDKARAVHAHRDASDAFHRITRALRLCMALETATAERLRGLRAGVAPARVEDRTVQPGSSVGPIGEKPIRGRVADLVDDAIAEDVDIDPILDLALDLRERLTDFDRFGPLLRRPFDEVVNLICADIGVTPDWNRWNGEGGTPQPATASKSGRALSEARSLALSSAIADPPTTLPPDRRLE